MTYNYSHLLGASSSFRSVWCGSAPTTDLKDMVRGVVGLATVPQQKPQPHRPSQAYANYSMGDTFQSWASHQFLLYWCLLCNYFLLSSSDMAASLGLRHWDLHHSNASEYTHGRDMCHLMFVQGSCEGCNKIGLSVHCFEKGKFHTSETAAI